MIFSIFIFQFYLSNDIFFVLFHWKMEIKKSKITIVIPCHVTHVKFLNRCLKSIYNQTLLPYEVIISISSIDFDKFDHKTELNIEKYSDKLNISIYLTAAKKYAGENRNIAIGKSSGDIISFIDMDDVMEPHRLFIIDQMFSMVPNCIGLLHYFNENTYIDNDYDSCSVNDNIKFLFDKTKVELYHYDQKIHYGHPTFRHCIFDEFKFNSAPRIQDFSFIETILPKYLKNLYVYKDELTCYISNDSTLYGNNFS
jgi:glycosyltransferase involved in cell wall biosynthesis